MSVQKRKERGRPEVSTMGLEGEKLRSGVGASGSACRRRGSARAASHVLREFGRQGQLPVMQNTSTPRIYAGTRKGCSRGADGRSAAVG